jgi:hypothetical protein
VTLVHFYSFDSSIRCNTEEDSSLTEDTALKNHPVLACALTEIHKRGRMAFGRGDGLKRQALAAHPAADEVHTEMGRFSL